MRWPIVRTLLHKEALRLAANRGALALAAILVVFALLLVVFDKGGTAALSGPSVVKWFWVDYWQDGPWVDHLRATVPEEWRSSVLFRPAGNIPRDRAGVFQYAPGHGAVQLRTLPGGADRHKVWFWHPGDDPAALAPFEEWFWRETRRYFHDRAVAALPTDRRDEARRVPPPPATNDPARLAAALDQQYRERMAALAAPAEAPPLPELEVERSALRTLDLRRAVGTALVLFALFLCCVYLQSSLTCEERERGVLLAQALSPATAAEILAAKALFYSATGVGLAAVLGGVCQPAVLRLPFFWLILFAAAAGSLGLGLTIACIARTQRAASMGALSYTLAVSMLIYLCGQNQIPGIPWLLIEYHVPRALRAALDGTVQFYHWFNLAATDGLALVWFTTAVVLFRRRGWQ